MKRRIALLLAAGLLGAGAAGVVPTASTAAPASHCKGDYVSASLSWGHKCLKAGQFCKVGNREYLRYRFVCPSSKHLRRR